VMIELRQVDPLGHTVTVCREGPRVLKSGELEGCVNSWPLAVREGSVVGEWLDRLVRSGLTRYQLVLEVGGRWWIDCVLHELNGLFAEAP